MAQRSFKLDDDLDAQLVKAAKEQGRSVSNLIVWAIVRELDVWAGYHPLKTGMPGARQPVPSIAAPLKEEFTFEGTPLPKIAPRKQR